MNIFRISYDRLVSIPDIARKNELSVFAAFIQVNFQRRRAKKVSDVDKPNGNARSNLNQVAIHAGLKELQHIFGILHVVKGFDQVCARAFPLAVFPFGFKLLDMRACREA